MEVRTYGLPHRANHREIGEAEIERIATCFKLEIGKLVVDIIHKTSQLRRAWGPPAGWPNRHTEVSRCAVLQRGFSEPEARKNYWCS